jgi:anaerobic magnesium-protoporphyrin IX monomethyl ester cyclase
MSKVIFAVPPVSLVKGTPCCTQNRQFQWFKDPTFIYPIIPAISMTMLAQKGHQIFWLDAVAEGMNEVEFGKLLIQSAPDYIVFECPTPLIARYKEIIQGIKDHMPNVKTILCGDHVTALPQDSNAHITIQGGKWHYEVFEKVHGTKWEGGLPHIDRELSKWWLYAYKNGNFRKTPGTYIQSAFDCVWGGCTFCSWAQYHNTYEVREAKDVVTEVVNLTNMGFKEIFDDSGTFPTGDWLQDFCTDIIDYGVHEHVTLGCNMRFGALNYEDMELMKASGFRMILWGLESANQKTLNMINKGIDINMIRNDLWLAHDAGLQSHVTCMFGLPGETYEDAKRTYDLVRFLLRKGIIFSAQATLCIPYPITPLFKACKEHNMLRTENWADYDMTMPVIHTDLTDKQIFALQKGIYNIAYHPEFIARKLVSIRSMDDLAYYWRIAKKLWNRFGNFPTDKIRIA